MQHYDEIEPTAYYAKLILDANCASCLVCMQHSYSLIIGVFVAPKPTQCRGRPAPPVARHYWNQSAAVSDLQSDIKKASVIKDL